MGSKGNVGCFGAMAILFVGAMIVSVIVFLLGVAGVLAGLGAAGWLVYSAISDLRRRGRLDRGVEPLQVTGARAQGVAERAHAASRDALSGSLESWQQLLVTRGIGTPLQDSFDAVHRRTVHDLTFQDLMLRAESAYAESFHQQPTRVRDLAASTVRMDDLTAEFRAAVHGADMAH